MPIRIDRSLGSSPTILPKPRRAAVSSAREENEVSEQSTSEIESRDSSEPSISIVNGKVPSEQASPVAPFQSEEAESDVPGNSLRNYPKQPAHH